MITLISGILMPLLGTSLGACCAIFMGKKANPLLQRGLTGFAAGVMVAASVWSLLIPAIEQSAPMGQFAFAPATIGLWLGFLFLMLLDYLIPHMHMNSHEAEGRSSNLGRTAMLLLAVALHNLPEGMAVGAVYAGYMSGDAPISAMTATALSIGIAVQNFPEGAIISLPLCAEGMSRTRAVLYGILSGLVEPVGALITLLAAGLVVPILPYMLGFAAGAMFYVVVEELIPEMSHGHHSHAGVIFFALGFTSMMVLDVVLG
ncbi:MAG: ZIP family metal transporter [Ruminococcaceae bacterium]|nr:ZIP family metal transporter [Oscillospiraceae bacterium]